MLVIAGAALAATIVPPTNCRDTGGDGRDGVYGQEGDDKVKGNSGPDVVCGGPGDNLVRGGTPERPNDGVHDVLDCGAGVDGVYFVPGQDEVKNCEVENPWQPWARPPGCKAMRGASRHEEGLARGGWGEQASPLEIIHPDTYVGV